MLAKAGNNSIVREIQNDVLADRTPVSNVLRKARLAARKLDLSKFEKWITSESDGYKDIAPNDLPDYRKIGCVPRFRNPYHGWCPIIIQDESLYEICHTSYLFQSIAELENLLSSEGALTYSYPHGITQILHNSMDIKFEIRAFISQSSLAQPINAVKNILLDWAVDLEKAGVTGDGLGFSVEDRKEAATVTQNIYAQNIGNLGNVSDKSNVTNNLSHNTFSLEQVGTYVKQIRNAVAALPPNLQKSVEDEISTIEASKENAGTVRKALNSIKTICENAAGNLAAEGITALISRVL